MDTTRSSQRALFILLLGSLIIVALVMKPIAVALFLAAILAGALWPTHSRLTRVFRGKQSLAAGTVVLAVILLVLGPLVALSTFVVKETSEAITFVQKTLRSEGVEGLISRLPDRLEGPARRAVEQIPVDRNGDVDSSVQEQVTARGGQAAAVVGGAVAATGSLVFQSVLMLIALFFFLTQKEAVLTWVDDASPLRRGQTRELMHEFRKVSVAVMRSSFLTALVQAVAATVGYFIVKVPHPLFFGAVTFFVALIPAVGAASVCLAAALLMFLTGHPISAIFLTIWGIAVVGLVDNVVKPLLIKGGVQMHGAVVFFALLGGLAAFGAIGLLLGPLAVSLFIALLRIYRRDYGDGIPPGGGTAGEVRNGDRASTMTATRPPLLPGQPQEA